MRNKLNQKFLKEKMAIIFVFLSAFVVRLYRITWEPLHIDEYAQANVYSLPLDKLTSMAFSWGRHPPLDFYVGKIMASIFGFSTLTLRLPSAIFGALASLLIFLFLQNVLDKKAALIGAFFSIVWFPAIFYSQYVRPYSIFLCFFALSIYLLTRLTYDSRATKFFYASLTILIWTRGGDGVIASVLIWMIYLYRIYKKPMNALQIKWGLFFISNLVIVFIAMNSSNHSIIFTDLDTLQTRVMNFPNFWLNLVDYGQIKFSLLIGLTLTILLLSKQLRHRVGWIYFIVIMHSFASIFFLGVFSNQGIYPRYQVIYLLLISTSIGIVYNYISSIKSKIRYVIISLLLVTLVYTLIISHAERNRIHNYSYDRINMKIKTVTNQVAFILGGPNQYLPGWPQIENELLGNVPIWLPEYAINLDRKAEGLIIFAKPDEGLGFLPVVTTLERYQLKANSIDTFRSDAIHYERIEDGLLTVESIEGKDLRNYWIDLALMKFYFLNNDANELKTRVNNFCNSYNLQTSLDLGPAWGQWGTQITLAMLLQKNNILLDCNIKTYGRNNVG
jgi:hypothetical protein